MHMTMLHTHSESLLAFPRKGNDDCLDSHTWRVHAQVAFVIGGLRRQTSTLKPFNPILGETYQAQYSSGLQVYAEQISHHPPVSSWQVEDAQGRVSIFLFMLKGVAAHSLLLTNKMCASHTCLSNRC